MRITFLLFLLSIGIVTNSYSQTITNIYVDSSATGLNNGTSWANAFTSFDSALNVSRRQLIDTVYVAKGTYKPSQLPPGSIGSTGTRDYSFYFPDFGQYVGGFPSGGGVRDAKRNRTILSGDIGVAGDISDNTYHVTIFADVEFDMDGFIISDGNANGTDSLQIGARKIERSSGGGIYQTSASPYLINLIIKNNRAIDGGGMAGRRLAWVTFIQSVFQGNTAVNNGGAISLDTGGRLNVVNCVFFKNNAAQGGGIYQYRNNSGIAHSSFVNNSGVGGAIYDWKVYDASITNCVFSKNAITPLLSNPGNPNSDIHDEPISPGVSGTNPTNCLLQCYTGWECVYATDALLFNVSDPDGPDDLWGTADDGLRITPASVAFNAGANGISTVDITGAPRDRTGIFDIGAYEIPSCGQYIGRTVYVDSTILGSHCGTSWNDAFNNLQAAINIVWLGLADTIKVAKGTYLTSTVPRKWSNPLGIESQYYFTFHLPSNCVLLGGYSSGGTLRDPDLYPTVLTHTFSVPAPNIALITIVKSGNIIVDGLTLLQGGAYRPSQPVTIDANTYGTDVGGAMLISQSSSTVIKNCRFYNNYSGKKGGAIYSDNSLVKLEISRFEKNRVLGSLPNSEGGAIFFESMVAGTYIRQCYFKSNSTAAYGGALAFANNTNATLIDSCLFEQNNTFIIDEKGSAGGAIMVRNGSKIIVRHSTFNGNYSYQGGAIVCKDSPGASVISQSVFINNSANIGGGAVSIVSGNGLNIANCLFYKNSSPTGGALNASGGTQVSFSTFYNNHATSTGGAICNAVGGACTLTGNVLWGNDLNGSTTSAGSDINAVVAGGYSLFQALSIPGSHNITGVYPEFQDTSNVQGPDNIFGTTDDGLQLKANSPLVNESTNNLTGLLGTDPNDYLSDIKGDPRVEGRYPDPGAYETNFCELANFTNRTAYVDSSNSGGDHSGNSWQNSFTTLEDALRIARTHCIDTIKIAKGTYLPGAAPGFNKFNTGTAIKTFVIPDSVYIQGAFPPGGGQRSFAKNPTLFPGETTNKQFWFNSVKNSTLDGLILDRGNIIAEGSELILKNTVLKRGQVEGSSPLFFSACKANVINCVFANNTGNFISATILQESSFVDYINTVFSENYLYNLASSCLFLRGTGSANVTNCTFYHNTCVNGGTITRYSDAVQLNLKNSLFWNNTFFTYGANINDLWLQDNKRSNFTASHNLFTNANLNRFGDSSIYGINPAFADTTSLVGPDGQWLTPDDGLALSDTSVSINEGDNSFVPVGITTDIAGLIRIANGKVDIGAYEFECTGARGYTNKLVPLGTEETSLNRLLGCGSLRYMESQTTPDKYIALISDNGNVINPSSVTVDATTSLANFRTNGTDTTMLANRMVSIVAPGTYPVNGGVRVRVYYDPAEFADLPKGIRSWYKHPGHTKTEILNDLTYNGLGNAVLLTPSSIGTENGIAYAEFSNITSFSTFGFMGMTTVGPLPVNFLSFTAEESLNKTVLLKWKTGWEKNNDRFEVERSADGSYWRKIGTVKGSGTIFQDASYSFTDDNPETTQSFYRLKQVDQDEKFRYSVVRQVTFNSDNGRFIVGPNPASSQTEIRFSKTQSLVNYEVLDIGGRIKLKGRQQNVRKVTIQTAGLENGVYLLKINNSSSKLIISR